MNGARVIEVVGELELVPCDPVVDGELIRELTRANFYPLLADRWDEARNQRQPEHPERFRMVRRLGATIGFFATHLEDDALYLETIQLAAAERGRGTGTVLLRHLAAQAARDGLRAIRLRVLHGNHRALALYVRLGYEIIEDKPDARVLERLVRP